MRVVSLLPSATETLCRIIGSGKGFGVELVGRSHECDFPAGVMDRPVLTRAASAFADLTSSEIDRAVSSSLGEGRSLYEVDGALLQDLRPDLIITQDLCSVCSIDLASVRRLASELRSQPAILSLNPQSFEDVLDDVLRVGEAIGLPDRATETVVALRERFFRSSEWVTPYVEGPRALLLEWTDPPFVGGHWTPQLIERAGASHPLNPTQVMPGAGAGEGGHMAFRVAGPSRRTTPEAIQAMAPEAIVVAPCGYDLARTERDHASLREQTWWRALPAVRDGRVALVDGNQMFNRPGPRLVDAFEFLVGWLNDRPELIPEDFPWRRAD